MYISIYPGGIQGFDWIFLGIGIFADMATYFGGYFERERVPLRQPHSFDLASVAGEACGARVHRLNLSAANPAGM